MLFETGRLFQLGVLLLAFILVYFALMRSESGHVPKIKSLPPLEAMREAVERSAELDRPVFYTPGWGGGFSASIGSGLLASITLLADVAKTCAETGARLMVMAANPSTIPLLEASVREGYIKANRMDEYRDDTIRYATPELYSYAAWVAGAIRREKAGANLLIGQHAMESLIFAEAGVEVEAMQVAGSGWSSQIPYYIATCDYVFLASELYAASAFISEDPAEIGTIRGQDLFTFFIAILAIIGALFATAGSNLIINLMGM